MAKKKTDHAKLAAKAKAAGVSTVDFARGKAGAKGPDGDEAMGFMARIRKAAPAGRRSRMKAKA